MLLVTNAERAGTDYGSATLTQVNQKLPYAAAQQTAACPIDPTKHAWKEL